MRQYGIVFGTQRALICVTDVSTVPRTNYDNNLVDSVLTLKQSPTLEPPNENAD